MTPERLANYKLRIPIMRPQMSKAVTELVTEIERCWSRLEETAILEELLEDFRPAPSTRTRWDRILNGL